MFVQQPTSPACASRENYAKANIAPRILVDDDEQTRKTRQHLSGFPYEHSTVVIHRDRNLMPTLKKDWAVRNVCFYRNYGFDLVCTL